MDKLIEKIGLDLDITGKEEDTIFAQQRHIDAFNLVRNHLQGILSNTGEDVGLEILAESIETKSAGL